MTTDPDALRFDPRNGWSCPVVRVYSRDRCLWSLSFTAEGQPINPPAAATPDLLAAAWQAWANRDNTQQQS